LFIAAIVLLLPTTLIDDKSSMAIFTSCVIWTYLCLYYELCSAIHCSAAKRQAKMFFGCWIWLIEYYCENHKYGVSYATALNESHIHTADIVRTGVPFERTRPTTTGSHRFGTNCLIITELLGSDIDLRDYPSC
jgi:hypothetical protein